MFGQNVRVKRCHLSTGKRVVACANGIKIIVHIQGGSLLRSLEHHVFQHMRHAGGADLAGVGHPAAIGDDAGGAHAGADRGADRGELGDSIRPVEARAAAEEVSC